MVIYRQFVMEWKLYSRDRVAMFWTFAFPLFLLLGFGTIFRNGSVAGPHALTHAAYLLPGLLGMNLVSMGLFNVGMVIVNYREKGKYRRLAVTPLPTWIFLLGQILHRLSLTALQASLMLAVGHFVFGISNQGSYLLLAGVMGLGTACFMAMGFALAGFARTAEGYSAFANAFFFPMMFLSGVYFSVDTAPRWMQVAVVMLPLSPYLKALRAIFNDGASLAGQGAGLAVVVLWTVACFGLAVRRFRWV